MSHRLKQKKTLLSFVGTNDIGKLDGSNDGAVLTVLKHRKFDQVHLLWNPAEKRGHRYEDVAKYLKREIEHRGYSNLVETYRFDCEDVTDHNEIYPKLLSLCRVIKGDEEGHFTAAIASGTPAMQACWILMAESGDFPLVLIRSNEPGYGRKPVTPVKLGTGLPRIVSLSEENRKLREEIIDLVPVLELDDTRGRAKVGDVVLDLSPIEYCYYRYFAQRVLDGEGLEHFRGPSMPKHFITAIGKYYRGIFPDKDDSNIRNAERIGLGLDTFRGNYSKANSGIKASLPDSSWKKPFLLVAGEGRRSAREYGLSLPAGKIIVVSLR